MNIQLEKKTIVVLSLAVVANYCFWRMHWIFINNDHLEKNMVKFVENRRNIIRMVVLQKINLGCLLNTWRMDSIALALALTHKWKLPIF